MRFVCLDFESANPRLTSICQAGIVIFDNGVDVFNESILIDPQDYFDPRHVAIHGIVEDHVLGKPTFAEAFGRIEELMRGEITVSHTAFDRTALIQSCTLHGTRNIVCRWLDSARVARRAWPQYAQSGYGLANLANEFGIKFQHHDAVEDARAAGYVLLKAIEDTGIQLEDWFSRVQRPISGKSSYPEQIKLDGGTDGPLAGEVCVFTGELHISRREAAELANKAGSAVAPSVTKKTTLVVVGDQDMNRLAGKTKSSKHLRAEELVAEGFPIQILQESDFMALVEE